MYTLPFRRDGRAAGGGGASCERKENFPLLAALGGKIAYVIK